MRSNWRRYVILAETGGAAVGAAAGQEIEYSAEAALIGAGAGLLSGYILEMKLIKRAGRIVVKGCA